MATGLRTEESRAWRGLLTAHARLIRILDSELISATGLSLVQYEVLLFLHAAPEHSMRMSQLAESTLLSKSGITRSIDQLAKVGLVERKRCPADARGYLAVLTDLGAKRLRDAAPIHIEGVRRNFTSKLDAIQLDQLGKLLSVITDEAIDTDCGEAV